MTAPFDPNQTTLLLLHLQVGILRRLPTASPVIENAASAITIACRRGAQVAYIRVALDEEDLEAIPKHGSASFVNVKNSKESSAMMHPDAPSTQIHPKLAPKYGDVVYRKIRTGPFMTGPSKALLNDFAAQVIENIIIGGVSTSSAVLSAVKQLSDLDFHLVVLEDCCADLDDELHNVLCEKVLPKQAKVIITSELDCLFDS